MKLGEFLLNEKTKVSLSLVNFLLLFGFIITAAFTAATWTAKIENKVDSISEKVKDTDLKIEEETTERKEADKKVELELEENMAVMIETQTNLAEIKTDIKWIRAALEKR